MSEPSITASELVEGMDDLRSVAYARGFIAGYKAAVEMLDGNFNGTSELSEQVAVLDRFTAKYAKVAA